MSPTERVRALAVRVLALAAAVGMVLAALALRAAREDRAGGGAPRQAGRGNAARLVCAEEVGEACRALAARAPDVEVRVEAAGATAARLISTGVGPEGPDLDGWLVPQPWPAIVASTLQSQGLPALVADTSASLARSPLVIAIWGERADVLARRCGPTVTWRCLGDAAPRRWSQVGGREEWGLVKLGIADPQNSATGLLVLGQATASYFGAKPVSRFELSDDGYRAWLTGLRRAVPASEASAGAPVEQMLTFGPSKFDAAGDLEAHAGPLLQQTARRGSLTLVSPQPATAAEVVLARVGGTSAGQRLLDLWSGEAGRAALAAAGWRVEGRPLAPGLDPAVPLAPPGSSGLPPAGVLDALRDAWKEVSR